MNPLTYEEFFSAYVGEPRLAWEGTARRVPDAFKKIVVVKAPIVPWHDDKKILYTGVEQFLQEERALEL